ncbi:MAG: peptide-binding protein [Pseudomonadota bacterium]
MRRIVTVVFCLLAGLVWGDEPRPPLPALYAVTGVAADDLLNVRAAPDGSAEVIGTLPHDAEGIEVITLSREGNWAAVNIIERQGWVAMRFLRATVMPKNAFGLPAALQCFGTEPFWDITFTTDGQIRLNTPEGNGCHDVLSTAPPADFVDLARGSFRFQWRDKSTRVTAHILPGTCYDGMSDRAYGLHYIDDHGPRIGCCSLN